MNMILPFGRILFFLQRVHVKQTHVFPASVAAAAADTAISTTKIHVFVLNSQSLCLSPFSSPFLFTFILLLSKKASDFSLYRGRLAFCVTFNCTMNRFFLRIFYLSFSIHSYSMASKSYYCYLRHTLTDAHIHEIKARERGKFGLRGKECMCINCV